MALNRTDALQTMDYSVRQQEPETSYGVSLSWLHFYNPADSLLPPYGSPMRDYKLREIWYTSHGTLFQGAITNLITRYTATPWEISGGRNLTRRYQELLQNVEFGEGWDVFWEKVWTDYFTQDAGAFVEVIGAGNPDKPIRGQALGLAHLDRQRCVPTGNYEYPVVYYNDVTGDKPGKPTFHRMHHTRVIRFRDMVSPIERAFGNGFCALSRMISVANAQMLMGRYINEKLVNAPPAGLLTIGNVLNEDVDAVRAQYSSDRSEQGNSTYAPIMYMRAKDPSHPIEINFQSFAELPDHFNRKEYMETDVNLVALALGVDPQDIWPLTGQALGTGTQSKILAAKGQSKTPAKMLKMSSRAINLWVLPESLEFEHKYTDAERDKEEAEAAKLWVDTVNAAPLSDMEKRQLLANRVPAYADVLTDEAGNVRLIDDDVQTEETTAQDDVTLAPTDATPTPEPQETEIEDAADEATDEKASFEEKDYLTTETAFIRDLTDLIKGGLSGDIDRRRFGTVMRGMLSRYGRQAYTDGLADGGVEVGEDGLDEDAQSTIASWLSKQSVYVTDFANTLYSDTPGVQDPSAKAVLWANKSLDEVYMDGVADADRNGLYEFVGHDGEESCKTCSRLKGQKHRLSEWIRKRLRPKIDTDNFECGGWRCEHTLAKTKGKAQGRW